MERGRRVKRCDGDEFFVAHVVRHVRVGHDEGHDAGHVQLLDGRDGTVYTQRSCHAQLDGWRFDDRLERV